MQAEKSCWNYETASKAQTKQAEAQEADLEPKAVLLSAAPAMLFMEPCRLELSVY